MLKKRRLGPVLEGRLAATHRNIQSQIIPYSIRASSSVIRAAGLLRLLLAFVLTIGTPASFAEELQHGRVVGLTITVLDDRLSQHRVRLAGIDAPEKGQPFGNRSKAHLSALVMGRPIEVKWHKKDRYGRIVRVVRTNAYDAGLKQVRAGMGWHYKGYAKEQRTSDRQAMRRPKTRRRLCGGVSGQTGSRRHRGITGPPSGRIGANYADGVRKCSLMRPHSHSASAGDNPHPNRLRSTSCSSGRTRDSSGMSLCLLCSA